MDYEIFDPMNLLSKTQKTKIRRLLREGADKNVILENIHYRDDISYKDLRIEKLNEKTSKIFFLTTDPKDELKQRLRFKLKNASVVRSNQYKDECWKLYHQILQHPSIRPLPNESLVKALPNPDQIREKKDVYRMMNQMNPNPLIKDYIEKCLQD